MEKYEMQKTMKSKNCHFVMKNQYCQKYCHYQKFSTKNLP